MSALRGRAGEWAAVERLLRQVHGGGSGVLLVDGMAGSGKTRLLDESARLAADLAVAVEMGAADELQQLVALGPLLRPLGGALENPPPNVSDQRLWLIERLREELEQRARRTPVLVAIDDLHWADPTTLLALRMLPAQLGSSPVAWLLARRSEIEAPMLDQVFSTLKAAGAQQIHLGPLPQEAVVELTADILGGPPDPALESLLADAGGVPFLIVELLEGLRDEHAVAVEDGTATLLSTEVPRRVHDVIGRRLLRLSPEAAQLLEVAAVLGRSFSLEEVADVLGERPGRLLAPLRQALNAGVIVPESDALSFRHDLVWQAVYQRILEPVRRALHRQIGEMLLVKRDSAVPAAAHLLHCVRRGDRDAIAALERAARELLASAPQSAARLALRALELTDPDDPDRFPRAVTAVDSLVGARRLGEATELAVSTLLERLPPEQNAQLRLSLASILAFNGRARETVAEAERVLAEPALPEALRLRAELVRLHALLTLDDYITGRQPAEAVLGSPPRPETDALRSVAHLVLAFLAWEEGRLGDAVDLMRRAPGSPAGATARTLGTYPSLGFMPMLTAFGEFDEAHQIARREQSAIERAGDTLWIALPPVFNARVHLAAGRLADALADAQVAHTVADEVGTQMHTLMASCALAEVELRRGDLKAASEHVRSYRSMLPGDRATFHPFQYTWVEAQLVEALDGPGQAFTQLADVYGNPSAYTPLLIENPGAAAWLVRVALANADAGGAERVAATADHLAVRNPKFGSVVAAGLHARSLLDRDAAGLIEASQRHRHPWAGASAAEDAAVVLTSTGEESQAIDLLTQALETYEQMGATRDARRVRSRLRALGVRRRDWRVLDRPVSGWDSLTENERAVARLVAEGMTNREVAERMFLSPHTVGFHLRQIFRKLEVDSRRKLAGFAKEQT